MEVKPVSLNEGERDFVLDLRKFYETNKTFFANQEFYLLRNMSKGRGIGFFEAGNFYPDFIVWLLTGQKQYVTFVDPKGLRNLSGPDDPKIRFYRTIKEIEAGLADSEIVLNSFIIANTPYQQVAWWDKGISKAELEKCNVLFQKEDRDTYVRKMLTQVAGK